MSGRLNVFQRVMHQWNGLAPYNAGQAAKLAGPLRLDDLREAMREANARCGLGVVEMAADAHRFRHEPGPAPEIDVLPDAPDPRAALAAHVSGELTRPFAGRRYCPWRVYALEAGPEAHYVGLIYDHWVADSVAMRLYLRHVSERYLGLTIPGNGSGLSLYPPTYRQAFRSRLDGFGLAGGLAGTMRLLAQLRRAYRVAYWSTAQMDARFELHETRPGTPDLLRGFARSVGATVHDVFLAALAKAMARFMPRRSRRARRNQLALGTIIDTRADADVDLSNAFGLFLGYYVIQCRPNARTSLVDAVRRIGIATRRIKADRRYLATLLNMKVGSLVWPLLSERARPHFLRETLTLTAGVSNVSLRRTWIEQHTDGRILEYIRTSPTGPLLPLVVTPTTLGDTMNVGFTYRTTGFSRSRLAALTEAFLDLIQNPA